MKTINIASCLGVLSACLAISSPAIAEENCSGYTAGVGTARVDINDDHASPRHLATGDCHPTGKWTGECTFEDEDGDKWSNVTKSKEPLGVEGTWRIVSGTGKFANFVGASGWWKLARTGPVDVWAWGGYCPLADKKN